MASGLVAKLMEGLTGPEKEVIEMAGAVMHRFALLPTQHMSDLKEVEFHVHALQNIVGVRVAQRTNPDTMPIRNW